MGKNIDDLYPGGAYLSVKSATERKLVGVDLVISGSDIETFGEGKDAKEKVVLTFSETEKKLALNSTNAHILSKAYGQSPDDWVGKSLNISVVKVEYQGTLTDGLQVKSVEVESDAGKVA